MTATHEMHEAPLLPAQQNDLEPFLNWMSTCAFREPPGTFRHDLAKYLALVCGIASTAVAGLLAFGFSKRAAHYLNLETPAEKALLGLWFGIISFIPMAVLVCRRAIIEFKRTFTKTPIEEKAIPRKSLFSRGTYSAYILFFSLSAGIADTANTYQQFSTYIGLGSIFFMICDMFGSSLLNGWAFKSLSVQITESFQKKFLTYCSDAKIQNSTTLMRWKLKQETKKTLTYLNSLTEEQKIQVLALINPEDINPNIALRSIFSYSREPEALVPKSRILTLIGFFGLLIGALGSYVYWPLGGAASDYILSWFSVKNEAVLNFFRNLLSTSAMVCMGSLGAISNQEQYEKTATSLYNSIKKLYNRVAHHYEQIGEAEISCCRKFLTFLSLIIALTSVSSRTENVIIHADTDKWYGIPLIVTAILPTLVTRFWAMERLFDAKYAEPTPLSKVKNGILRIKNEIGKVSPDLIGELYNQTRPRV